MDKKQYLVENVGCDDTTTTILELTQGEFDFLNNIFEIMNKNSSCGCQPKIYFNLTQKYEKIEGYKDEFDYAERTGDYCSDIKNINGDLYKFEW